MNFRASHALVVGILTVARFGGSAVADTMGEGANPYAVISERNVFRLNPPPALAAPEQKPIDLPKVTLNGIFQMGNETRALLAIPSKDQKEAIHYFNLAPGQRENPLELVEINLVKGEVAIINSGTRMTLSLSSNSLAVTTGASQRGVSMPSAALVPAERGIPSLEAGVATSQIASSATRGNRVLSGIPGVAAGNFGGGVSFGAPSATGTGSSPQTAAPAGGDPRIATASVISDSSGSAVGGYSAGVYLPPNPGSATADMLGSEAGNALLNPENSQYRSPIPPTLPGGSH